MSGREFLPNDSVACHTSCRKQNFTYTANSPWFGKMFFLPPNSDKKIFIPPTLMNSPENHSSTANKFKNL